MSMTGRCYCGAVRYEADGPGDLDQNAQPWRLMPEGVPQFPGFPGR